ncbi:hypothetical protein EON83_14515, partial [bacterium]
MPKTITPPTIFCASTLTQARLAAWQHLQNNGTSTVLDPPLVLASPLSFVAWRSFASKNATGALLFPRLVAPELFFARSHSANTRTHWLG